MRTDVKVGLICVFALVLAVVAYFAFQSNPDKQKAPESSTVATGSTPTEGIPGGATLAVTPEAATTSAPSMTAPETPIAGGGSLLGPRTTLAQVAPDNTFSGPVIAPPGATAGPTTAPAVTPSVPSLVTTPSIPSTGPALSGAPSLLPPVTPTGSSPSSSIVPAPSYSSTPGYSPTPSYAPSSLSHGTVELPPPATHRPSSLDLPLPGESTSSLIGGSTGSASTYVIQKGDMLGAIAKKNGVTLKALEAANPGVNPNKLKVGAKINIPAQTPSTPATPSSTHGTATTKPATGSHRTTTKPATTKPAAHTSIKPGSSYTVKKGDSLRKIAKAAYGDENAWRRIFRANRGDMSSADDLTIGQVIKIPQ